MESPGIDKAQFTTAVEVKALRIPVERSQSLLKSLSQCGSPRFLYVRKGFPKIIHIDDDPTHRLLLLRPDLDPIPDPIQTLGLQILNYTVNITYDHFSHDVPVPSGFETVGHLAHFNLQETQLPYKHLIGQVVLDVGDRQKTKVRTVVNKVDSIHNTFRTFEMELLAGDPDYFVTLVSFTQKEGNCTFQFDFRKVYWSSKLSNERQRLLKLLLPGQILCDMFAGVGPLSIQAAKKGLTVISNDLNPDCYEAMVSNAVKNKVSGRMHVYNMDARAFLRAVVSPDQEEEGKYEDALRAPPFSILPKPLNHVYMNLPMDALEFLDVFKGAFRPESYPVLPLLHVYAFSSLEDPREEFEGRIRSIWGDWDTSLMTILPVRDVAPRKMMFCVQIQLEPRVAFPQASDVSPTPEKRRKLS